ncbi:MAG: hypothetical protein ACTS8Z_03430, partial [Candidatus Limnocylindrales bacterium]
MTARSFHWAWSLAAILVAILVVAGCTAVGSSPSTAAGSPTPAACAATPAPQGTPDGWDVGAQRPSVFPQIINPSGAIACGRTRLMFSFLDANNAPVAAPDRSVEVALYDLGADPTKAAITGPAMFIWAIEPTTGVYVIDADFPTSGAWGAEFRTAVGDAAPEAIRMTFEVQPTSAVVSVGERAPASDTPTLSDVGGDVSQISTDDSPVTAFYETSVADALAARKPFVLAFATPKFCASAQCGPTLDRLKPIAAAHPDVTVINVEPYQLQETDGQLQPVMTGDPPNLTPAAATTEWRLVSEPWVFVVDKDGIVR